MQTQEYFENLAKLDDDDVHPEFHTYTAVWVRARMPEAYNELKSYFKHIESEIHAQYAQKDASSEMPF